MTHECFYPEMDHLWSLHTENDREVGRSESRDLFECSVCGKRWVGVFPWPGENRWLPEGHLEYSETHIMAAKTFWTRAQADANANIIVSAFGSATYDVRPYIKNIVVCGDIRRNPGIQRVKHLCVVGVCVPGANIAEARGYVKANVNGFLPGAPVRNFKIYDYVELPDQSGNVSWLVVEEAYAGAAFAQATGPVDFIKMLELFAESQGFSFGASGLKAGKEKVPTPDEDTLFRMIGAKMVELHEREGANYIDPVESV